MRRRGDDLGAPQSGAQVGPQPRRNVDAEPAQQLAEIARPGDGHRHVAHGVLDDQVPPDDPGDELPEGRVRVRVGAAGDGHERGELGIAEGAEAASEGGDQDRDDQRWSGADVVGAAGRCRADDREDSGADDRADTERDQLDGTEGALEMGGGIFRLGEKRVEGLPSKQPAQVAGRITKKSWRARIGGGCSGRGGSSSGGPEGGSSAGGRSGTGSTIGSCGDPGSLGS